MFKKAIVLTGGIATGKSTVSNFLKMYGYSIIDADEISHKILDKSIESIKEIFGEEFIKDNRVDRKKLGGVIFANREAKESLEKLLHPKIRVEIEEKALKIEKRNITYFIDIPLFFETKSYEIEKSLVIYAPKNLQLKRVMQRDNLSEIEALNRINSQMDINKKKNLASFVIDNSSDLKHLQREIEKFISIIKE